MISLRLLLPLLLVVPTLAEAADDIQATAGDVVAVDEASSDEPAPTKKKKKKKKTDTPVVQETGAPAAEADPSARSDDNKPAKKKKKKTADAGNAADAATEGKTTKTTDDNDGAIILAVDADARLGVGALTGDGIHRSPDGGPSAMSVVAVDMEPSLEWTMLTLSLPSKVEHRETWGGHLSRSTASSSLALEFKPMRQFRSTVEVGVAASSRPEWLDPYQPIDNLPDTGLIATDRRGRFDTIVGARLMAVPWSKTFARLNYNFTRSATVKDPAFDAIERPNHLTPRDNDEHTLRGSFKTTLGSLKPSLGVSVFRREWFFVFARDAGSGATHAGPGGDPPNSLQTFHGLDVEPEAQLSLLNEAVVLDVGWRLRVVDDLYDGYYSRVENRFSMGVETTTGPPELSLETKTRFDVNEVIYGDQAYAAGGRHPPLDYGDRRELRRSTLSVSARFPAKAAVHVFAEVAATAQVTNFPDYATGVFPTTQAYEVDWDYQTARALIGLEMVLDVEDTPLR